MDLNAPLGMTPPPPHRRSRAVVLAGGIAATALAGLGLALVLGDPYGGRPFALADLPPMPPPAPAQARPEPLVAANDTNLDATPTGTMLSPIDTAATMIRPAAAAASLEGGVLVHRGGGGEVEGATRAAGPGPLVIDVTRELDRPFGKAKVAMLGNKSDAAKPARPRVAIFVSGMGLDAAATRTATEIMPPAVTLAFVPYGDNAAAAVAAAKSKGHEVLLQLPMRNTGGGAPGPHALRSDTSADALNGDLAWLLGRFTGYDGVSNLLGAPVTADNGAMTIVLKATRARHLFYLDDGTSHRSVALAVARDLDAAAAKTDLVLDATTDPAVVRANVDQLLATARRKGQAIGMASGLPEHLGLIARLSAEMGTKGFDLVPVNALVRDQAPAAATR